MASPIRRRALLWALLPILVVLNLLLWTGLGDWLRESGRRELPEFDPSLIYGDWLELSEEDFARLDAGQVPVRVTDSSYRTPIGNARIWILDHDEGIHKKWTATLVPLPERDPDLSADENGLFWFSFEEYAIAFLLAARPDGEFPYGHVHVLFNDHRDNPSTFVGFVETIAAPHPLFEVQIKIRDRSGKELTQVPVFLKNFIGEKAVPMFPNPNRTLWAAQQFPDAADGSGAYESLGWRIGAGAEDGPSVPLQEKHWQGTAIELELAASGSLEVHVNVVDDQPVPTSLPIRVQRRALSRRWPSDAFVTDPPLTVEGVATIAGVGLKERWLVGAPILADDRYFWKEVQGPQEEGEVCRVDLDLRSTSRVIHGTLTEPDGRPLSDCRLGATLRMREASDRAHFSLTTDAEGNFTCHVPLRPGAAWSLLELSVDESSRPPSSSIEIPLNDVQEDENVGVFVVKPEEFQGAVEILDERGKPLSGATAWIRALEFQDSGAPGPWLNNEVHAGWLHFTRHRVYGEPPYEVVISHPLYSTAQGVLERKGDSITMAMSPAARVRGRVLMPESCTAAVEILPAMTSVPPWDSAESFEKSSAASPYGFFNCGPFYPGTYDLELRIAGILMARVGRVVLEAGKTIAPPALQMLDLRHCTPMRVMLAHAPSRVRNDDLIMHVEYSDGHLNPLTARALLLPPEATRVKVEAEGCTPVWLPVTAGTAFVTLELAED
ncbi:MAG: carboxypeptidase-like regulatory domain-containing protein [Planctomycetota bacterium]|nr:carboxypeptidase-like regulatory domain-containing protein [Planctomycetota bacterium]